MKNKYYTPDISEFCVGFEYEVKSTFGDGTVKTLKDYNKAKWIKEVYSLRSFPYVDRTMSGNNPANLPSAIRVKYLDKKDVESFGFKHDPDDDGEEYPSSYEKHGWSTAYPIDTQDVDNTVYILYYFEDNFIIIDKIYKCGSYPYIFQGMIKNKSELKKLLIQLGVLKNE